MIRITMQGEKLRDDFQGTRMKNVVYGFQGPTNGVSTVLPPGLIPWDRDFGLIVQETMGTKPGVDPFDYLSVYSAAFREWLGSVFTAGGNQIPVVYGRARQAFANYWYALPDQMKANYLQTCGNGSADAGSLTDEQRNTPPPGLELAKYPLPFISYYPPEAPKHRDGRSVAPLRNLKFLNRERTKTMWAKPPTPYFLTYQVDVWTKYETMHNWMFSLFDGAFQNQLSYLSVANPYFEPNEGGENILGAIHWRGSTDNTDLESTEQSDPICRWTFNVEVEAWRFYEARQAPVVKKVIGDVVDYTGPGSQQLVEVVKDYDQIAPTPSP